MSEGTQPLQVKYESCPLCGGTEIDPHILADCQASAGWRPELPPTIEWMRCRRCAHSFTRHYWTPHALKLMFGSFELPAVDNIKATSKRHDFADVVNNVIALRGGYENAFNDQPVWLDVGCGDGMMVATAAEFGFRAAGLDTIESLVEGLKALGCEAILGDFDRITLQGTPNVISFLDTLEHMPFPHHTVHKAAGMLPPGGLLVISLPAYESSAWRIMDRNRTNPYWVEIGHHHNFNLQRLKSLLQHHGLQVVRVEAPARYVAQLEVYARKPAV